MSARTRTNTRHINLALQGGGAHGAFTWGVLDRLLEDERIVIEGISGTSAGALNAAALAQGYVAGGAQGARHTLEEFWRGVSAYAPFGPVQRSAFDRLTGNWNLDQSAAAFWLNFVSGVISPYQTNPLNLHPVRQVLARLMDIPAIRACREIKLIVWVLLLRFAGHEPRL